jgi:hypothetical protein
MEEARRETAAIAKTIIQLTTGAAREIMANPRIIINIAKNIKMVFRVIFVCPLKMVY